jgi:Periplasmic copper-binding protein (NosD)
MRLARPGQRQALTVPTPNQGLGVAAGTTGAHPADPGDSWEGRTMRAAVTLIACLVAGAAHSAVYTPFRVTHTYDSDPGSLRWAIHQVNAHGSYGKIVFDASLSGATISPTLALPAVTAPYTIIDGDIDNDGAPDITLNGKSLAAGCGLLVQTDHVWIEGLAVVSFPTCGIDLDGASYVTVKACHLGANLDGDVPLPSGECEIRLTHCDSCTIGSTDSAYRNVIGSASEGPDTGPPAGIAVYSSSNNRFVGNYIGLTRDGTTGLDPVFRGQDGILIVVQDEPSTGNEIGGTITSGGNLIAGVYCGIDLRGADHTVITGNLFGLAANGEDIVWMWFGGVAAARGAHGNMIGGNEPGLRNVFAGSRYGVWTGSAPGETGRNTIRGNYFGCNRDGTAQRRLDYGVSLFSDDETIGGAGAEAGNYFAVSDAAEGGTAVALDGPFSTVVRNNTFGRLPNGAAVPGTRTGVWLVDRAEARITDNRFVGADVAILARDSAKPSIYGNRFADCTSAVYARDSAQCHLGDLGNESTRDDGGNVFRYIGRFLISNRTANAVKAEGNDFGATGAARIDRKIRDQLDDPAYGRVDYDPLEGGVHPTGQGGGLAVTGALAVATGAGAEIAFTLSAPGEVTVTVLNLAGRPVAAPLRGTPCGAGAQRVVWDRHTSGGTRAPAGRYIVQVAVRGAAGGQSRRLWSLTLP